MEFRFVVIITLTNMKILLLRNIYLIYLIINYVERKESSTQHVDDTVDEVTANLLT